ncbi:MAG: hypothetical protein L0241_01475 [Planctomycetia bacterium]|nr:hypothetical protein [Planctomycetia bacterium]
MSPATPAAPAVPAGYVAPAPPSPGLAPAGVPVATGPVPDEEIRVYGHNNLFYWWPVWAVGFLMAFLTYIDGHVMAIVPAGTTVESGQVLPGENKPQEVLVPPPGQHVPPSSSKSDDPSPRLRVAANNNYGVIFIGTILLVVIVTNLTLRGLASIIAIAMLAIVGLTLGLLGWWDDVLWWLGGLDVRMNAGGYLAIAIPLFLIWVFSTFVYDHYTYLIVTRGQVRIRKEIGEGEIAVDTSGMHLEKKRDDIFRHWLLGFGSGDLRVKTGGPSNLDFDLPNVLFIGSKLSRIHDLIREKEVSHQSAGA